MTLHDAMVSVTLAVPGASGEHIDAALALAHFTEEDGPVLTSVRLDLAVLYARKIAGQDRS